MTMIKAKKESSADSGDAMSMEDRAIDAMGNLKEIMQEVSIMAMNRSERPGGSLKGVATSLAGEAAKIASACKSQIAEFRNADLKPIKAACRAIESIGEAWRSESGDDSILRSRVTFAIAAVDHASNALDHDLNNAKIRSGDRSRDIQRYRSSDDSSIAEIGKIVHQMDEHAGARRHDVA